MLPIKFLDPKNMLLFIDFKDKYINGKKSMYIKMQ